MTVAVAQETWNALRTVGRGAPGGGTLGIGFPDADQAGRNDRGRIRDSYWRGLMVRGIPMYLGAAWLFKMTSEVTPEFAMDA
jgi:hypothetical protein